MLNTFGWKVAKTSGLVVMVGVLSAYKAVFAGNTDTRTFVGVITDTMCGSSHRDMKVSPDSKCVLECIRLDEKDRYALFDGKSLYVLSDQKTSATFAAQRVKVTGQLFRKTGVLKVDSIESARGSAANI